MTQARRIPPDEARERRIARVRGLAILMDTAVRLPGTRIGIGLDPLIGLIPGVGDVLTTLVSLYIVFEGYRLGASWGTIAKMLLNIGIDFLVGEIPVLGDVLDFGILANRRNLRLLGLDDGTMIEFDLLNWLQGPPSHSRGDTMP